MMRKRPAEEDASGASPLKRSHIREEPHDAAIPDFITPGSPADETYQDLSFSSSSSSSSPAASPSTAAESPVTTATTPRKFPSDYKTLACTWPNCTKRFNRPARLRDHMNSHTKSRPHKCPYPGCTKDYIEDKHLKHHIKGVHRNERKYVCPVAGCAKGFVTGTRLKRHQAVHEGADRFRCADCGQSFRKRETLTKHVRKDHLGRRAHACAEPGCERDFDTKPALLRHRQRDHGEPLFWCGECPSLKEDGKGGRTGFTTDALLQQHMRRHHQQCPFCEYTSPSRWAFIAHTDAHHSGKSLDERRTVRCPREGCAKAFTKRSNLNAHIRSAHDGVRFVCGQVDLAALLPLGEGCGVSFSTKVRLEDHVRFVHLGLQRPKTSNPTAPAEDVVDELAGIANANKITINCPSCDEAFSRYFDLNLHIARAHDPNPDMDDDEGLFPSHDPSVWADPAQRDFFFTDFGLDYVTDPMLDAS